MRASQIEREVAVAALAGELPGVALLERGLASFYGVRNALQAAVRAAVESRRARRSVWITLRRRARLELPLVERTGALASPPPVARVHRRNYNPRNYNPVTPHSITRAAEWLAADIRGDAQVLVRVLLGIERARQQCFRLAEEQTRWLP